MLCKKIDFSSEKVSWRVQMLSKKLYNLHIYIDADYKKTLVFTPAPVLYACRYSFAMSTHVCNVINVILTDFVKNSGFECCFRSARCIETQTRTSDNVEIWVFTSLNVQRWSFVVMLCIATPYVQINPHFINSKKQCLPALFLFRCLPSSLLVLILTANNQRHFMLNETWR